MKEQKLAPYYLQEDYRDIEVAETFEELLVVAFRVLRRMPRAAAMVCGPISTGGAGSVVANLRLFNLVIERLVIEGEMIFSQMPFEDKIQEIKKNKDYYKDGNHLLEVFYGPIFSSGFVQTFYFMSDWQSSVGATWERDKVDGLGLEIIDLWGRLHGPFFCTCSISR